MEDPCTAGAQPGDLRGSYDGDGADRVGLHAGGHGTGPLYSNRAVATEVADSLRDAHFGWLLYWQGEKSVCGHVGGRCEFGCVVEICKLYS